MYNSGEQITSVEQVKISDQMWFSSSISMSNLGEKLDRNVEMRVLGCLISEKERKNERYRIYNGGSRVYTCDIRCYFPSI